jgi:hypothetical protein
MMRMLKIKLFITATLLIINGFVFGQELNKTIVQSERFNSFLDISPNSNYIIYSSSLEGFEIGDYYEGLIYIYNRESDRSELLNRDTLDISSVQVTWGSDNEVLFFLNSNVIFYLSIEDNVVTKPVFKPLNQDEKIENFFLSKDNKYMACWISNNSLAIKKLIVIDIQNNSYKELFTLNNDWLPEFNSSLAEWSVRKGCLFFIDMYSNLYEINIESGERELLQEQVENDILLNNGNNLFYRKGNRLIAYDIESKKEQEVISVEGLEINFISPNRDGSMIISFNNQVMYYAPAKSIAEIKYTSGKQSEVVFCNEEIYIEETSLDDNQRAIGYLIPKHN